MPFFNEDLTKKSLKEIRANKERLNSEIDSNFNRLEELKANDENNLRFLDTILSPEEMEVAKAESEILKNTIEKYTAEYNENYVFHRKLAQITFVASIIAMIAGLLFALNFIPSIFYGSNKDQTFATSVAALSIVSEIIAALFFAFHKVTSEQATFYFEKMENMKQKDLGIWLSERINDPEEKTKLLVEIAKSFIKKSEDMT